MHRSDALLFDRVFRVGGKQGVCCSRTRFCADLAHKNNEKLSLLTNPHLKPLPASAMGYGRVIIIFRYNLVL